MEPHPSIKALFEQAKRAFECAQTFEQLRDAHELSSTTLNLAMRRKKTAPELLQEVASLAIEAEYALGVAITEMGLSKGVPGNQHSGKKSGVVPAGTTPIRLSDLGISKNLSSRSQLLAKLAPNEVRVYIVDRKKQGLCPTLTGARMLARKKIDREAASQKPPVNRTKKTYSGKLDELLDHLKSMDNLMRDHYDGDTTGYTRSKGQLLKRFVRASLRLGLEAQSDGDGKAD